MTSINRVSGRVLGAGDRAVSAITSSASSVGYRAGWGLSQHLPEPWVTRAFEVMADRAARGGGRGVHQLRANLARARPDLDDGELADLTGEGMRSYLRYWREAFRLPQWSTAEIRARLVVSNPERLLDPLASGQGVVAVLGHFGNWDHAGAWVTTQGVRFTTVAERLRPDSLNDRFVAYRESLGMEVVPLTGGPDVTGILANRLQAGGLVALLADRDLGGAGLEVDLLGEPARLPAGPAMLALRTGSILLPTVSWYDRTHTRLDFLAPLTTSAPRLRDGVKDLTQQWAAIVGDTARHHARDWHMLQPVWSADRPAKDPATGPAKGPAGGGAR
ncbi:MAG: phosphatidylinositol mannoside acyltransferase [Actinomycetia bacterium]|nr:phosphatidylinositol mannoside acyltransferase [Actinomycetes bacterium]